MHESVSLEQMQELVRHFQIEGQVTRSGLYGSGHINDTYAVTVSRPGGDRRYIFQRINTQIFRNVDKLMSNIYRVSQHIRGKLESLPGGEPDRETLTIVPTRDEQPYYQTEGGDSWRAYLFIEGARTYDVLENPGQAYAAGEAFGKFQKLLADLPTPPLHETIPAFHDTPSRFANLEKAVAADSCERAANCQAEIDFALSLKQITGRLTEGLQSGRLPWRVTHNDTKINNVMLDDASGAGICVIDLDTVMPGSVLYDFGDQIRTTVGHFQENERDLSQVGVDLELFEQLAKGYLKISKDFLTQEEINLLPFSGMLITFETGLRFLTDYLQGDVYFKTHRPGENLDRCRTQFALVRSIQENERAMTAIVERYRN
jgi:Ser/Thr protein kinase RdoA (MazF antagonist)